MNAQELAEYLDTAVSLGYMGTEKGITTLELDPADYVSLRHILGRVMLGELIEKPAPLPQYTQPAMINDYEGSPLFSITEN